MPLIQIAVSKCTTGTSIRSCCGSYWKDIVLVLGVLSVIVLLAKTTTRSAQTVQAFHVLRLQQRPIDISSMARVTIQSSQILPSASLSLSFLSILKSVNYNQDIDGNGAQTNDKVQVAKVPLLIWFLLLDSTDGKPYTNTTATTVSTTPGSLFIVDQFRTAVKAQYDFPGYLKDIPAPNLLVYKNKAAFDAKDDPLKVSASLEGLGKDDDENALIVVVPPPLPRKKRKDELEAIERGEAFVNAVLEPYEDIPNSDGMKVLRNVVSLAEGGTSDVVLRTITEDFWLKVIAKLENYEIRTVCAVGTPGIGKTTTTCVLIRLLLTVKSEINVVFRLRTAANDGFVYVFTPSTINGTLTINVDVSKEDEFDFSHVNKPTTYYVVDPGETKVNCNRDHGFKGKVIIVASPDESHWGGSEFRKARYGRYGTFLYYPVWKIQELLASSKYLNAINKVFIDDEEIQDRFFRFGGVPRHIFIDNYKESIDTQEEALIKLSLEGAIELAYLDRSAIQTASTKLPKGVLLSYVLSDQDNSTYTKALALYCSDYVYEAVATKYKKDLFTKMMYDRGNFDHYLFESYCRTLLYDSVRPVFAEANFTVKRKIGSLLQKEPTWKLLGGCSRLKRVDNVIISPRKEELVLFTPYSTENRLVDFGYRKDNVYYLFQATIGKEHSVNPKHICELVVNEINATMPSLLIYQKPIDMQHVIGVPQFEFYYVVPEFVYKGFALRPANASIEAQSIIQTSLGMDTVLYQQWNDIVSIYIAYHRLED